jgi:periplasmic protein TonB
MTKEKEKKDKRTAAITTVIAHLALLALFFFFGLTYLDPKPEEGIPINFGYDLASSGSEYIEGPKEDVIQEASVQTESSNSEPSQEEIATQSTVETVSLPQNTSQNANPNPTDKPKEERQVDSRLNQLMQQNAGGGSGEGDQSNGTGDQGDPNGDVNAAHGQGGGNGGDGNYRLGNRIAVEKPKPQYICEEEGRIVVLIRVNRSGKVVFAEAGRNIPGGPTSNSLASCLLDKAKAAAMKTTWQADPGAEEEQIGYIVYNFKKI